MKLIRIEAIGFKSFANRIALNFDGEIVGIVGPNGSGKSNINDAIKWVLGEQSSKSLRGDKMEDVIFSGSKRAGPMEYAEVSLTFDNSKKVLKIPHKKIVITRKIYRGNRGNEYFINGEPARLRDLKVIAMESGVSKSSLAIISQGTVATIAESSPENRRFIFEEAAGISHYRVRKKEAMVKLEKTAESLSKLEMVTNELKKQLDPLRKQSEKATAFLDANEKLKGIEVGLLVYDIRNYTAELSDLDKSLQTVTTKRNSLSDRLDKVMSELKSKTDFKFKLDEEVHELDQNMARINDSLMQLKLRHAKITERRKLFLEESFVKKSEEQINALKSEVSDLNSKIKVTHQWVEDMQAEVKLKLDSARSQDVEISSLRMDKSLVQEKLFRLKSQRDILVDYEKNNTNLFRGTKTILENRTAFEGVHDIVGRLVEAKPKCEMAVETVLKNALQHIVVDNSDVAIKGIRFLRENKAGTATFIPMNTINPAVISDETLLVAKSVPGFVDVAKNLVTYDGKFSRVIDFLMGRVLVATEIQNATTLSKTLNQRYMVVTMGGDVVRTSGVLSGGHNVKERSLLNLKQQIAELDKFIPTLTIELNKIDEMVRTRENELNETHKLISEIKTKIQNNRDREKLLQSQFDELKTKYENQADEKLQLTSGDDLTLQIERVEVNRSNIRTQLSVKRSEIVTLNDNLKTLNNLKVDIEMELRKFERTHAEQFSQKDKLAFYIDRATKRLAENYETTYEFAKNEYTQKFDVTNARQQVHQLKKSIKKIGNVNLQALEDFGQINTRYGKLMANQKELETAKEVIVSAIDEMDHIMTSKFDQATRAIEIQFKKVFREMFSGGHVEIRYSDPKNLLETGVEIIAQPPGKSVRSLKLFSGGEKSLIAISLLFAILEYKPLPLCILDEAEASLDEVNVQKFAMYLHKLKSNTQFIIVTHRVGTMEKLDTLLGATMQSPGITSIFSVEMSQAKAIIEKSQEKLKELKGAS